MRCAVYYHSDFADKGYISLMHRVKPGFDGLKNMIKSGKLDVYTPVINQEAEDLLQQIHYARHIERVRSTPYHEVALLSAAGVTQAAEKLALGDLDFAFCFVGSAGHHASSNSAWGFCYYNDVGMAVKKLNSLDIHKIMIIDIDPHFGDGTLDILGDDSSVIHINFYADENYNYADRKRQNYGILLENADDEMLLTAVDEYLEQPWDYEFLIVIFGHDGHGQDYGDFYLSTKGYIEFAKRIKAFAVKKPILFVLSGGSNPQVAAEVIPGVIEVFTM